MGDKIISRTILPGSSTFYIALSRIFGIGRPTALNISEACGISQDMKVKDISPTYIQQVAKHIQDKYEVGDELKRSIRERILALVDMKSERGHRHVKGLSQHGRTHSNNSTAKKLNFLKMYDASNR